MKQEDKELLIKDLCGRLPYGVKVMLKGIHYPAIITTMDAQLGILYHNGNSYKIKDCKPYLRPMSSMTEEEKKELLKCTGSTIDTVIDFYNSKYFDYRGFIPKGLALEAIEGMYKFE